MASDSSPENPFESPQTVSKLRDPAGALQDFRVSIADILFCTFAVSISLMCLYQPWGGFEQFRPTYVASSVMTALSASVFFAANRRRSQSAIPFFALSPGHFVAMLGAGYWAVNVLQYLISFLDRVHVGAPIHILAELAPAISSAAISSVVCYRASLPPRWQAFFLTTTAYGVLYGVGIAADLNASPSELTGPFNVASYYSWRLVFALWALGGLFLLLAYVTDLIAQKKYDWLHHVAVLLNLSLYGAGALETPAVMQQLWRLYYQFSTI
jgi:hypothetical protein